MRGSIAARLGVNDPVEEQRLQPHNARMQESANFQLGGPEKLTGTEKRRLGGSLVHGRR